MTSPGFCGYYGPQYTATATVLYAHELGLVPITTPAYSPESNGLGEAFVHTFKRDTSTAPSFETRNWSWRNSGAGSRTTIARPPFGAWHAAAH